MGEVTRSLKQTERLLDSLIASIEGLESSNEYTAKTEDTILNGMYVHTKLSTHAHLTPHCHPTKLKLLVTLAK